MWVTGLHFFPGGVIPTLFFYIEVLIDFCGELG
ncbi:MAG: hypothetical protein RL179_848 [Planctomycetota bacterium]